jgi:hypothetical protein
MKALFGVTVLEVIRLTYLDEIWLDVLISNSFVTLLSLRGD